MGSKAIVLGAFGFLGQAAVRRLVEAGFEVAGLGHGGSKAGAVRAAGCRDWQSGSITVVELETLLDRFGLPDVVVHAGGAGTVSEVWKTPLAAFERSVASTAAVLETIRQRAPEALLIIASSAAVYGEQQQQPIIETVPAAPVSPYGTHKQMIENLAIGAARDFGLRICIIRFFSLYGPGLRKQLLFDICNRLTRGERSLLLAGEGSETRDFFHIDDATRLIVTLIGSESTGLRIINGGSGTPTTVSSAAKALIDAFGSDAKLGFTGVKPPGNPDHMCADLAACQRISFSPDVRFGDGIADYVDWFKARDAKAA